MPQQEENGLFVEEKRGVIHFALKFSIKRRLLWALLIFLALMFTILGSTMSEEIRKMLLDIIISMIQVVILREQRPS